METFDKFVREYWAVVVFFAVYARMRYGGKNIEKYKKWDAWRKKRKRIRGY